MALMVESRRLREPTSRVRPQRQSITPLSYETEGKQERSVKVPPELTSMDTTSRVAHIAAGGSPPRGDGSSEVLPDCRIELQ